MENVKNLELIRVSLVATPLWKTLRNNISVKTEDIFGERVELCGILEDEYFLW